MRTTIFAAVCAKCGLELELRGEEKKRKVEEILRRYGCSKCGSKIIQWSHRTVSKKRGSGREGIYLASGLKEKDENWPYHRPGCLWAEKLNTDETVEFTSIEEAEFAGYEACLWCVPDHHGPKPRCPYCGDWMNARRNNQTRSKFWGCKRYPECKGTAPYRRK